MAIVLADKKRLVIPMPAPEQKLLFDKICKTQVINIKDGQVLILPHHADTLRMMENMGINTKGCGLFEHYYQMPVSANGEKVWWWQVETANFLVNNPYSFVTSTPRTGKTLSTLMAVDFILKERGGKALIVAPLTVANKGEWQKACQEWLPHLKVVLVHKDREKDIRADADIFLINPDGLKLITKHLAHLVNIGVIKIVVFDELTEYVNYRSGRWRAAKEVSRNAEYRWGLTGTPGSPEKIFGQVKLINEKRVPKYYTRWEDLTMMKINQYKKIPKAGHESIVKEAMYPCIRFDKAQLMKIPIPQVRNVEVPLSLEQDKLTKKLVEDLQFMVDSEQVEAMTAGVVVQKLLQVSNGVVRTSDKDILHIDATPKLEKLWELLNETPRKKVIFSAFTGVNNMLVDFIRSRGMTCEKIDGSVTGNKRADILSDFLALKEPHVLVCHPRTCAYGIELASADMIICYGVPLAGPFLYQQLFERLSSARQKAKETFVVHLSAGKQDKLSFSALSRGVNIEQNIVNLFTKHIEELL